MGLAGMGFVWPSGFVSCVWCWYCEEGGQIRIVSVHGFQPFIVLPVNSSKREILYLRRIYCRMSHIVSMYRVSLMSNCLYGEKKKPNMRDNIVKNKQLPPFNSTKPPNLGRLNLGD